MIRLALAVFVWCLAPLLTLAAEIPVVRLRDLEARYKAGGDTVYVLNLWATWCKPCVAELPWFEKLHREQGRGNDSMPPIKVVLVSLDAVSTIDNVSAFVKRKGITAEVVVLNEAKPHTWIDRIDSSWSGAIPATLFIRNSGIQRRFFEQEFSYEELRSTLTTILRDHP